LPSRMMRHRLVSRQSRAVRSQNCEPEQNQVACQARFRGADDSAVALVRSHTATPGSSVDHTEAYPGSWRHTNGRSPTSASHYKRGTSLQRKVDVLFSTAILTRRSAGDFPALLRDYFPSTTKLAMLEPDGHQRVCRSPEMVHSGYRNYLRSDRNGMDAADHGLIAAWRKRDLRLCYKLFGERGALAVGYAAHSLV